MIVLAAALLLGGCKRQDSPSPRANPDSGAVLTTIDIVVQGIRSDDGKIMMALFESADGFPDKTDRAVWRLESDIAGDTLTVTVTEVPVGQYAVSVFHDENDNDEMETDFFGRPTEGYGFSQNARGRFGPPGFDDAAFDVTKDSVTIRIDLVYD